MWLAYLKATGTFFCTMVRPAERISTVSENGHRVMEGWEKCPEEDVIALVNQRTPPQKLKVALFCFSGPHRGEMIWLNQKTESLGCSADCSVVLTPGENHPAFEYRALVNGHTTFLGENGALFRVNGIEESRAELLDYDELVFLGNQFLVLSVGESNHE